MNEIINNTSKVIKFIIDNKIKFIECAYIDDSEDKSIFYQLKYDNYNIYIEMFLDETDDVAVVVEIFQNKDLIFNYGGDLDECLKFINEKLIKKEIENDDMSFTLKELNYFGTVVNETKLGGGKYIIGIDNDEYYMDYQGIKKI